MQHALRDYVRGKFTESLGPGPLSKNAEINLLNWSIQRARASSHEASWENKVFRELYKSKALQIMNELTRSADAISVELTVDGDRVNFNYKFIPQLVYRLKTKELDVKKLSGYSADVLWPDGPYAKALFELNAKKLKKENGQKEEEDYDGLFKCGKCKSTKTTYYQMQTRSADEPMVRILCFTFFTTFPDFFSRQHTSHARTAGSDGSAEFFNTHFRVIYISLF